MALNNSNGRDNSNSTFKPYNQADNKPKFAGDINQVDSSAFNPQNSNAKAFGVDIFANERPKQPQQNQQPQQKQQAYMNNTNASPFGNSNNNKPKPSPSYNRPPQNNNAKASPFGKPQNNNSYGNKPQNSSPFGNKPGGNNNNSSPFGNNPNANRNSKPVPTGPKPAKKYAHQWSLGIKFDVQNDQIILTVKDDTTHKTWRKLIGKHDTYGKQVKQEYFRIGKIIQNGNAKYTYPPNGVGAVQVNLTHANDGFNFAAPEI